VYLENTTSERERVRERGFRAYKGFKDPDLIKFPCFADTTERGDRG